MGRPVGTERIIAQTDNADDHDDDYVADTTRTSFRFPAYTPTIISIPTRTGEDHISSDDIKLQ